MSINIDDKSVKAGLKSGLSVKESDFKTPMKLVNNVQPVFLLNSVPEMQPEAIVSAAITQNTWYELLSEQINCVVYSIGFVQAIANEDIEIEFTVDSVVTTWTQTAVAGTQYYCCLGKYASGVGHVASVTPAVSPVLAGRKVSARYRKTTAAGANATYAKVIYGCY